MSFLPVLLLGALLQAPAQGQPRAAQAPVSASDRTAEAYFQFINGRRLESEGDTEGAVAAYERAAQLDPKGAEIRAELAALYARQDRAKEAIDWANRALAIDATNREAHRILGLVYAALSDQPAAGAALGLGAAPEEFTTRAISNLEQANADNIVDPTLHYSLGRMYLRRRLYPKAIDAFQRLQQEQPGVSDASVMLADAFAGAGRLDEARQTLKDALADQPDFSRARVRLAELYERSGDWEQAAAQYGLAVQREPGSAELKRRHASALLRAGQPAAARDAIQDLVKGPLASGTDLYLLFQADRDLGDLDAAESTARRLMKAEPDSVRGVYALSQVLDRRHDYQGEVKALEPAITRLRAAHAPGNQLAALLTQLGFAYQSLGRNDRAIEAFEQVRAATPRDAAGSVYLVQAYLVGGRNADAIALAERARVTFPDDLRLTELLAEAYRRQGHVDHGIALLEKTLQTRAEPSVYVSLSELYAAASRENDAIDLLTRARASFPDNEDVLFQLGAVLEQAHRDAEAERAFRDLLARDPLNAQALNYLGYMLADRGRSLDEAVTLIKRALDRDPGNASYLDSLGWAYFKLGRYDLAIENLRQAASELTTNSVVQEHLGDALFRLKRVDEAISAWQRALEGDGVSIQRDAIEAKIKDARKQGTSR